ncbi:FAD-linked oxidase C-terminal domain-containing protein [Flavobacteriaceae sp. LMIT009]
MLNKVAINLKDSLSGFSGEIYTDQLHRTIYATDASAYRMIPEAVAIPRSIEDIKLLIAFANNSKTSLIPRAAGTSLAGQCVGEGIVVDVSKHFNKVLEFDEKKQTVKVQPGVVRDELNEFLKPYGLFFGPNTSTSNRCMIGGMVGNNSSGTTSIKYGVTRDKVLSVDCVLSDGSEASFQSISKKEFEKKAREETLEGNIYNRLFELLSPQEIKEEIKKEFPKESIHRRNTGYAIDALINSEVFEESKKQLNLCKLLSGSEGTLAFTTAITLKLDKLPPANSIMIAAHFNSVNESLRAVVHAMKHDLFMCELMDKTILECTKNNREQSRNRFFVQEDPEAILMLEVRSDNLEELEKLADLIIDNLKDEGLGYAFPKLKGEDIDKAINLRKAGLGLLGNIVGDKKAVPCIEDTAVLVDDLPAYIEEFTAMMDKFGQKAVYYAHAGAGELHLRPILNLKKKEDVKLFRKITHETALLVRKYKGSFSGEHGDGIVRAEFIPLMIGEKNYELLKEVKKVFDPKNIFNPGKIVNAFSMDKNLRYFPDREEPEVETILDFSDSLGILRATEKCNGSGDCRKQYFAGGTMCPSYRATKNEKDTTRARANMLREVLTTSDKANRFDDKELKKVFDLCLSCKACASECPSNVDVAALKAEFQYQYYKSNKRPFRDKIFAANAKWSKLGNRVPALFNAITNTNISKNVLGISSHRKMPRLAKVTLRKWFIKNKKPINSNTVNGELFLFVDEFTNFYDVSVGIDAIELLTQLGYKVNIVDHAESGRSYLSKGFLDEVKQIANKNVKVFEGLIMEDKPLVGIEPSAVLSFRDEYLRLADNKKGAEYISKYTFTFEEFISNEMNKGNIKSDSFTSIEQTIKIHGHCHQKALSTIAHTQKMLELPVNYKASIINSGCCGMAGSFGYEKEHYEVSMKVGEDLFKRIQNMEGENIIAVSGTSCRHQIKDGVNKESFHPITILRKALA